MIVMTVMKVLKTKLSKYAPTSEMVNLLKQYTENQEQRYNAEANNSFGKTMKQLVDVMKTLHSKFMCGVD